MTPLRVRLPIRWKLPLLVCGLPLVMATAILWAAYREVRDSANDLAQERLGGAVGALATHFAAQFRTIESRMHDLASAPAIAGYLHQPSPDTRAALVRRIGSLRPGEGTTVWLDLLDATGAAMPPVAEGRPELPDLDVAELARLVAGADSAGIGALRRGDGGLVYPIVALVAERGVPRGYLVLWQRVFMGAENRLVEDLIGPDAVVHIGSEEGIWTDRDALVEPPAVDLGADGQLQRYVREGRGARLAVVQRIGTSAWIAMLELPESRVIAPVRRFLVRTGLATILIGVTGLVAGLVMSRQVTRPLRELTGAAALMSAGGHAVRVAVRGDDEAGRLGIAFNQMAERVDEEVEARATAEAQWRLLFAENPYPMWVFDQETLRFLAVNEAAIQNYGYSRDEFLAMTILEIRPPDQVALLHVDRGTDHPVDTPPSVFRHRRRDGSELDVETRTRALTFSGRPARLVLAEDVTRRVRLEAALRQSQKMEAIGLLAGGIAHDFNNFLAVIMTYTELAREGLRPDDPRAAELVEVSRAADRAHALTRQLLAFSRQQVVQPVVLDPTAALQAIESLLRRLLGEDIAIALRRGPDVGRVRIDPGQFEQVIMNLALNARDAMPGGGTLTLSIVAVELGEEEAHLHELSHAGRFAVVSVSDTGTGMTPEVRARIFEPFFTTKEMGRGTGLGLATVYGIAHQAGGSVTVYSVPEVGSTFRLYLPLVEATADDAMAPDLPGPLPRGTETILLVEDDAAVRAAAQAALERLGYHVLPAQGADDAVAQMARPPQHVDLIISDVVMPGMDGPTLVNQLRRDRPAVKAILMSGYAGDAISSRGVRDSGVTFLEKPFTVVSLARRVREVLDDRPG